MTEPRQTNSSEPPGLPPVVPPSGRYIAQLFIVPGLIVACVVAVLLLFSWMGATTKTPDGFMAGLRNVNPEVRWRTASDLAQVLLRDPKLAADPNFGIELAAQLEESLPEMKKEPPPADPKTATLRREYMVKRSEVQYLSACLGHMSTPVGASVLCEIAAKPISPNEKTDALLRRQAVWALGEMGYNRKRLEKLSPEKREHVQKELDRLAGVPGPHGEWAHAVKDNRVTANVIAALASCATAEDPFLRKEAALALTFWEGTPEENGLADQALLWLSRDDGRGPRIEITDKD